MFIPNVTNMNSPRTGGKVANQYLITLDSEIKSIEEIGGENTKVYFQSYDSIIAYKDIVTNQVVLDPIYWNYSRTTSKYRCIFLGETTKETQKKIDSGEYTLVDLNGGEA